MLDRIILFSIRNKLIIAMLTLALVAWGTYSITQLPIDAVPDITNNQVQIITRSPSLAPPEVERLITFPIEIALSSIPYRTEIRSISRFGLSVVTIVFEEHIDIYWARQRVSERMKEAESQIPSGIGKPELAPVSTGLGEIYQYVLRAKSGFEAKFTPMELRSVQDWIVRRQLLGTQGVADVSSFGGFLKQYEIALDPDRLRAMNISTQEVFTALEENNQNSGGAYIDNKPQAYSIRTEGLAKNTDDIAKIVVKTRADGIPILIRDVATVQLGSAIRYGAMTRTAPNETSGEVVGGIVMMLKGENSSKVIANVKERIETISASLPEGVEIVPYLDRTKLVFNAIKTVITNLAEGALIVIFVLVVFLGNVRAGLVVASAIPLSLLFAISLMNVFGVSGNLMSLGAIDFGIIVDGAVIIVEATLHHFHEHKITHRMTQTEMDAEVYDAASKIRSSAAFGEIIILIVYLPILALVGVEGKMFRPMAETVSFAILGAFILSLTYIPMMSALFLSKEPSTKETLSDRMMSALQRVYEPVLRWALRQKIVVVGVSLAMLTGALVLFLSMGGEFIPTLDEGDFAVGVRVMTGSSLSHSVETAIKVGETLMKRFPEVEQTVGRIGASEIPTDPMPVEATDLMVILKPHSEWKTAHTREELAEKMQEVLETIPGAEYEFLQPIQMRFNELISGARQDVVVKIFGENMDVLAEQATKIGAIAGKIQGAQDIYVERVSGLPQIIVRPDRDALARFGVSVNAVNGAVRTAFAGESAGLIYENEQRYDLVVRLDTANRRSIEDVQRLLIATPAGNTVPLSELADVRFELGPNQVQREDAKRRIMVGFNVRNRDVESIVAELRGKIQAQVKLPTGYFIHYGGSFENLIEAKKRLSIAVPIALLLIFTLLYFTFRSVKFGLLIFTAIPLSAIGGVVALWLRGMPFSISAGIGFIALFGVAVLNGIVLVGYFNRLKAEGMTDLREIVLKGTRVRLRPVLMTAAVASLGFLPMAISTSSGAEVQKPLATVVIGGLVSATLLTLIVLPVLYILVETWSERRDKKRSEQDSDNKTPLQTGGETALIILVLFFCGTSAFAQASPQSSLPQNSSPQAISLEQAIETALKRNPTLQTGRTEIELQRALKRTATDIGKTNVSLQLGQYNSFAQDNNLTISQTIPFPTVFTSQAAFGEAQIHGAELKFATTRNELVFAVKSAFYQLAVLSERERLLREQDSLLAAFAKAAAKRYTTGETTQLEAGVAALQASEITATLAQTRADMLSAQTQLQTVLATGAPVQILAPASLKRSLQMPTDTTTFTRNPLYAFVKQQIAIAQAAQSVEAARVLPDISIGYFSQTLIGTQEGSRVFGSSDRFSGVQLGIALPLWFVPQLAKVEAAELAADIARTNAEAYRVQLSGEYAKAVQQFVKYKTNVDYYEQNALPQAAQVQKTAQQLYERGEIGYLEYSQSLARVLAVKTNYVESVAAYNHAVLTLELLAGIE
ncbi:MAG: CusA/CzcA family heavy metal efflux RND transporter [Ignavibacteria bacterium]|nr:CusA/CzcA family heavy metal efflux RND transporter [Ignavibacteria bacterium]